MSERPRQLELGLETGPACLARQLERARAPSGLARATNRSTSSAAGVSSRDANSIRSMPAAHPDAGRRRSVELLDQAVVATAAADTGLSAERVAGELEHGPRVVVQAADQRRIELVADAGVVEQRPDLREVLGVLGREAVEQLRCVAHHGSGTRGR